MTTVIPSSVQTKSWRLKQSWYKNGKHNECEIYQINQINQIISYKMEKTHDRIDSESNVIVNIKNPYTYVDGFKYTENFDRKITVNNKTYYINLKFVCDMGGSQTRTLKEVYNFIKYQKLITNEDTYFINILDGDTSNKYIKMLQSLIKTKKNKKSIFIGDMYDFKEYYEENNMF